MSKFPLIFILLSGNQIFAEQIVYKMSLLGYTFGEMVVTKTVENDSTEFYTLKAKGNFNFLWIKRVGETDYQVRYQNGKLISSNYKRVENGEIIEWTEILFDGEKYQVNSHKGNSSFTDVPDYSVLKLYFGQKPDRDRIFCEAGSEFSILSEKKSNELEVSCSDGSHSTYHVKDGGVHLVEIRGTFGTVKMKRVDEKRSARI